MVVLGWYLAYRRWAPDFALGSAGKVKKLLHGSVKNLVLLSEFKSVKSRLAVGMWFVDAYLPTRDSFWVFLLEAALPCSFPIVRGAFLRRLAHGYPTQKASGSTRCCLRKQKCTILLPSDELLPKMHACLICWSSVLNVYPWFSFSVDQPQQPATSCKCLDATKYNLRRLKIQSPLNRFSIDQAEMNLSWIQRDTKRNQEDSVGLPSILRLMDCMVPAPHQLDNQNVLAQLESVLVLPRIHHWHMFHM